MKKTLFTRHRNTVEPMMLANNRKATLLAIHSDAVNNAVKDQKNNIVLDGLPSPIRATQKKTYTRKERATLAQLRSGYFKLLGSYKSRIRKDASLDVCADCSKTPTRRQASFRLPGSFDDIDSVRPVEQTNGIYPGIQLSRGGTPRLRRSKT